MIRIYDKFDVDFTGNGLGAIRPMACTAEWTLNGAYELRLVCGVHDARASALALGNVIIAPVPVEETPMVDIDAQAAVSARIYAVDNDGQRATMRSAAGSGKPIIAKYLDGAELVLLKDAGSGWLRMLGPDGVAGYVKGDELEYQRTEAVPARQSAVIRPQTVREQPFRICELIPGLETMEARARHLSYDLADNRIRPVHVTMRTRQDAADMILAACVDQGHGFEIWCEGTDTASMQITEMVSPLEAILGAEGLIERFGGELVRDWTTIFIVNRRGADRGVHMDYGRNIERLRGSIHTDDMATRIVPIGRDGEGNDLYLPEGWVDSARINDWPHPILRELVVEDASTEVMTETEAYAMMREAAQKALADGIDQATVSLEIGYVDLSETEAFERFRQLQRLCPGDTVKVGLKHIGMTLEQRLTGYNYDCVAGRYTGVMLGNPQGGIESAAITARQLPTRGIVASKLAAGAASARALGNGSVTAAKLAAGSVTAAALGTGIPTFRMLMTSYTPTEAQLTEWSADGYEDWWTTTTETTGARVGDTVALRMADPARGGTVCIVGVVTQTGGTYTIKMVSRSLLRSGATGSTGARGASTWALGTNYSYSAAQIAQYGAAGYEGVWTIADAITGVMAGDVAMIRVANSDTGTDAIILTTVLQNAGNSQLRLRSVGAIG